MQWQSYQFVNTGHCSGMESPRIVVVFNYSDFGRDFVCCMPSHTHTYTDSFTKSTRIVSSLVHG